LCALEIHQAFTETAVAKAQAEVKLILLKNAEYVELERLKFNTEVAQALSATQARTAICTDVPPCSTLTTLTAVFFFCFLLIYLGTCDYG
jgi:hypothetical protein